MKNKQKTSQMTKIVLLVSFLILLGRLIYAIPGAIEHHAQKKQLQMPPETTQPVSAPQNP
ncbi:hypothetical protein CIG19_14640 [Enterobacterales bacterium CwR94]|nr:hypothetical protein CIG19_14640 [Enterobacterales bacterium CwR94]